MYFFDTYALWELVKKKQSYEQYSRTKIICSIFNAYEFYVTLRKDFDEQTAKKFVSILEGCIVDISINNAMEAVEMKKKYNKQDISFIDCLGYIKAKELKIKFLTGDKEFETMQNVEFVK